MLAKAWRWLLAPLRGKRPGRLRLRVHRQPAYESFWQPVDLPPQHSHLKIYLEAINLAGGPCWIVAADLAGLPVHQTVIGVRDATTRRFAPDSPLPPRQLTTVSLDFLVDGHPPSTGQPFRATVVLTDHVGVQHRVDAILH
jgi:hypothetical protein